MVIILKLLINWQYLENDILDNKMKKIGMFKVGSLEVLST